MYIFIQNHDSMNSPSTYWKAFVFLIKPRIHTTVRANKELTRVKALWPLCPYRTVKLFCSNVQNWIVYHRRKYSEPQEVLMGDSEYSGSQQLTSLRVSLKLTRCARLYRLSGYISSKNCWKEESLTCEAAHKLCRELQYHSFHKLSSMLGWAFSNAVAFESSIFL